MPALSVDIFHCCRPCLRRLAVQKRAFTSTQPRRKHGALSTFHPTPSPPLDALLATFRTNVFLPAHLIRLQQDLIYKQTNWPLLTGDEPATVRLGDEVLQLHPLDRTRDEPRTKQSFHTVVALMAESGDWRNLAPFLEELRIARRTVGVGMLEKTVRRAVRGGKFGVVLECLRRVEGTGVGLWDPGVAREVVWGATARMVQGEWSQEAVEKACRYAENVWELMWDPKHAAIVDGWNVRAQPDVLGVLMQVHAAKAVMFGEGKDEGGLVDKYARLVLKYWKNAAVDFEDNGIAEEGWNEANHKLVVWAPVWHGMKMAKRVVGEQSPLGKSLGEKLEQDLEPLLRKAQALLAEAAPNPGTRRGLILYEELSKHS